MKKISDHKEINGCEEVKDCMRIGSKVSVNYKNKTPVSFSEIKGGISFPTLSSPGYYCLIGRRSYVDRNLKAPLILLSEHEEAIPDDLFKRLCEDARKYFCLNFYANVSEADYGYYNDFITSRNQRRQTAGNVWPGR